MKRLILYCRGPHQDGVYLAVDLPDKAKLLELGKLAGQLRKKHDIGEAAILAGDPLAVFDSLPQLDADDELASAAMEQGVIVDLNDAQEGEPGYRGLRVVISESDIWLTFYHKYDTSPDGYESISISWERAYEFAAELAKGVADGKR